MRTPLIGKQDPRPVICTVFVLIFGLALHPPVLAHTSTNVNKLEYQNCGAYIVKDYTVHWKSDGKNKTKNVRNLTGKGNKATFNLDSFGIPEGAEVWLSFSIDTGDNEGCRKTHTRYYYSSTANKTARYSSKGETLTNNRCRINPAGCDET